MSLPAGETAGLRLQIHRNGKDPMRGLQQQWRWADDKGGALKQVARFAGSEMTAVTDARGGFELLYLHFLTGGFKTMEEAKATAPQFARQCLKFMQELIYDHYGSPAQTQERCRALVAAYDKEVERRLQEASERFSRVYQDNARRRGQYDQE